MDFCQREATKMTVRNSSQSTFLNRRDLLKSAGRGLAALTLLHTAPQASGAGRNLGAPGPQRNIVFVLSDDHRYDFMGFMQGAPSFLETPNMDRMAKDGITFTDAHASTSVCTPSRYGILTGRYAWRGRLQRWVLWPYARPLIEPGRLTLPRLLRDNGYHTACIGKWHLGMDWPFTENCVTDGLLPNHRQEIARVSRIVDHGKSIGGGPTAWGFDYYFGVDVPNFPPYCFIENEHTVGIPDQPKPDETFGLPGLMLEGWDLEAIMPILTRKCVDYINGRAGADKPFFLYFPMTGPHTPIAPTAEFRGKSEAGEYGDFVTQLDDTVGQIHAALKRNGFERETMVVLASDNGSPGRKGSFHQPGTVTEEFGHNPSWILRGMKADTWDGGHRIPFIVKWPERVVAGSKCDQLVCLMDLMGTISAMVDAQMPDGAAEDSLNVLPCLTGERLTEPIRDVLVHHGGNGLFGIRKGSWKFIDGTGSGGFSPDPSLSIYCPPGQLYNMHEDINEQRNLYDEFFEIVDELSALLNDYRRAGCAGTVES